MWFGEAVKRTIYALGLHVVLALVGYGLLMLISQDVRILSQSIQDKLFDNPTALDRRLRDVQGVIAAAGGAALFGSLVFTSAWLALAEATLPVDNTTARSRTVSWCVCLLLAVVTATGVGWFIIVREGIDQWFAPGILTIRGAIILLIVLLAYYLSTALFVKRSMRPSVPLALILPIP